jgi:serine/threonine protein kinase/Flp pilus assembly protein TadD
MKCPKCQSDNLDTSTFCSDCGTNLTTPKDIPITKTIETPKEELTTGSVFAGRYKIVTELGKGGMGSVYRAIDNEINEEIALKLIKPEISSDEKTIERFKNELKTARRIAHKNVCKMYYIGEESGIRYITMEYVEGQDLKRLIRQTSQLAIPTALSIVKQICEGLAEAHKLGVVHRDLKPNNIMIDDDGNARIMDFGIARSLKAKGITGSGVMIGTPEYMSPEQVEAKEIDQRSDIYSLGVLLYEMTTSRLPFEADTPFAVGMKHKGEAPKDPKEFNNQIPEELSHVILKCLEKDKEQRYQRAEDLRFDLEKIEQGLPTAERVEPKRKPLTSKEITVTFGLKKLFIPALVIALFAIVAIVFWQLSSQKKDTSRVPIESSIAVLPFADLSPQKDQEYFCDGMTLEIIAKLSKLKEWKVIPRTSVMQYKDTQKDVQQIGQELGVENILEGSIQKEEDDIRIIATLIEVKDSKHLWSDTYDQKLERVFDIQFDIAEKIAISLKNELSPEEEQLVQKRPTENMEAYNLYLQGRWYLDKREVGFSKAIEYFEKAIQKDQDFALAYVGLADSYFLAGFYRAIPGEEANKKGRVMIERALELDDTIGEAYATLGMLKIMTFDWEGAAAEYQHAIELNPNYAPAHHRYSYLLSLSGRHEEALQEALKALELDPLSEVMTRGLGKVYYFAEEYDLAIEKINQALELNPKSSDAYEYLFPLYLKKMMHRESIQSLDQFLKLNEVEIRIANIEEVHSRADYNKALQQIAELPSIQPYMKAMIYNFLGEKVLTFKWLEKAYHDDFTLIWRLKEEPVFDNLHSDQRYQELIKKIGFRE